MRKTPSHNYVNVYQKVPRRSYMPTKAWLVAQPTLYQTQTKNKSDKNFCLNTIININIQHKTAISYSAQPFVGPFSSRCRGRQVCQAKPKPVLPEKWNIFAVAAIMTMATAMQTFIFSLRCMILRHEYYIRMKIYGRIAQSIHC